MITEWRCDQCNFWEQASIPKKEMMKLLREKGWSVGKRALCPVCNGRYFKERTE